MNIGVIEICEKSHYFAASTIVTLFASDKNNQVYFFIEKEIYNKVEPDGFPENVKIIICNIDKPASELTKKICDVKLDVIYICTLSRYFYYFLQIPLPKLTFFAIHNTNEWFDNGVIKRTGLLLFNLKEAILKLNIKDSYITIVLFIKSFFREVLKKKFLRKLKKNNYLLVVFSAGQKKNLCKHEEQSEKILELPMTIYNQDFAETKNTFQNKKELRVCIPGTVSNVNRDNINFIRSLLDHSSSISGKVIFDFLGFIPENEIYFLEWFKKLKLKNISVEYYLNFISNKDFENSIYKCDIILGNLRINLNPYQKYGETKQSSTIYHMIRFAKPGIFPANYTLEFSNTENILKYSNYEELVNILLNLYNDRKLLQKISESAFQFSSNYLPEIIYETKILPHLKKVF